METFDPRTLAKPVYESLRQLRAQTRDQEKLKEQKNQAVELYTYLSTWGLLRLKAEEDALSQDGKKQVVKEFFACLEEVSGQKGIANSNGLDRLMQLRVEEYLGLTGLGLALAQEFGFWAMAIYHDIKGGE